MVVLAIQFLLETQCLFPFFFFEWFYQFLRIVEEQNSFGLFDADLFYLGFLSQTLTIHKTAGEGRCFLTPLYHVFCLHRHFDLSWMMTAESSLLHKANSQTRIEILLSDRKLLTTKLRALNVSIIVAPRSGFYEAKTSSSTVKLSSKTSISGKI